MIIIIKKIHLINQHRAVSSTFACTRACILIEMSSTGTALDEKEVPALLFMFYDIKATARALSKFK